MIKLEEFSYQDEVVFTIGLVKETKSIVLFDKYKNVLEFGSNGISLDSEYDIVIRSKSNIDINGSEIKVNAKSSLEAKGRTTKLFADGITEIKGSLVNIN